MKTFMFVSILFIGCGGTSVYNEVVPVGMGSTGGASTSTGGMHGGSGGMEEGGHFAAGGNVSGFAGGSDGGSGSNGATGGSMDNSNAGSAGSMAGTNHTGGSSQSGMSGSGGASMAGSGGASGSAMGGSSGSTGMMCPKNNLVCDNTCKVPWDMMTCGACDHDCTKVAHAMSYCYIPQDPNAPFDSYFCEIQKCDPTYYDIDHDRSNGCEYHCVPTGNPQTCDGLDDLCTGKINDVTDFNGVLASDPKNCGACYHMCNTGESCLYGKCMVVNNGG